MKMQEARRRRGWRVVIALAASGVVSASASAITIRDDVPQANYDSLLNGNSTYSAVGRVDFAGFITSGTLISPKWVFTAGHATNTADSHTFTLSGGPALPEAQHFANPGYPGTNNDMDNGLIQLVNPVSGVTPASRFFGASEFNFTGTMVGFGQTGTGVSGALGPATAGTRHAAQNTLDGVSGNLVLADFDGPGAAETFNWLGSSTPLPLEGSIAPGDSGGGLFVDMGPRTYLDADNVFLTAPNSNDNNPNASYTDGMGFVRIAPFNSWIDDNISNIWATNTSGTFGTATNWTLGPSATPLAPSSGDIASFVFGGSYTVTFGGGVSNHMLLARGGNVTLNLNNSTYTLTSTMYEGGIVVGRYDGEVASITFVNGTVNCNDVILGQKFNAKGTLTIGNNATFNSGGSVYVGGSYETANAGTFNIPGGTGTLNITGATANVNIAGTLKVYASGTVNYNAGSLSVGNLDVNGRVTLSAGGNKVLRVKSVTTNGVGRINLNDNDMIVDYTGTSPIDSIKGQISQGYNAGGWNGVGLSSSRAATSPNAGELGKTALGYGEAGVLHRSSFDGIAVDSTTVLVKYTYFGDADLDGDADGVDIGTWATNFTGELGGLGSMVWTQGDWDYDGDVDGVDAGLWAQSFTGELGGGGLGSIFIDTPISAGAMQILNGMGITVVPEPGMAAIMVLGLAAVAASRRRGGRRIA